MVKLLGSPERHPRSLRGRWRFLRGFLKIFVIRDVQTFYSIDQVNDEDARVPIEIVNKLNPQGMPLHVISLKLGSIIMLLRNLNPADGHCNGTRYIVTNMAKHVIEAVIPDGIHKGKVLYIPRIYNTPPKNFSPTMTRIQFPIKLAFAITSNKSQGQSLESIGIYLNTGEFKAH